MRDNTVCSLGGIVYPKEGWKLAAIIFPVLSVLWKRNHTDTFSSPLQLVASAAEADSLRVYKDKLQNAEQDKKNLQQQVQHLETSLAESQANANIMSNVDATGLCLTSSQGS